MYRWLAVISAILFLLSAGVVYAGFFTFVFGRLVYGRLWQPVRVTAPKLQFRLVELFTLFLLLSTAIVFAQSIWPVIEETQCVLVKLPQTVATEITLWLAASPLGASRPMTNLDFLDRVTTPAIPSGVALFSWVLGALLVQANRIDRTFDCLVLRLVVAPLGTICLVLFPTIVAFTVVDLLTFGNPLPSIDAVLWHAVVLAGGSLLGLAYCRSMAGWLVLRGANADTATDSSKLEKPLRTGLLRVQRFLQPIGAGVGMAIVFAVGISQWQDWTFRIQERANLRELESHAIGLGNLASPESFFPIQVLPQPSLVTGYERLTVTEAEGKIAGTELVLAVKIGDEARAYPLNMLNGPSREIINDELGGRAIAATW